MIQDIGEGVFSNLQEDEIAEARWFAPEEVIKLTNDASVFSDLVWIFLNENGI